MIIGTVITWIWLFTEELTDGLVIVAWVFDIPAEELPITLDALFVGIVRLRIVVELYVSDISMVLTILLLYDGTDGILYTSDDDVNPSNSLEPIFWNNCLVISSTWTAG